MKIISKTGAWDIIISENKKDAVYLFANSIQVRDIAGRKMKSMVKTPYEYYGSIMVAKKKIFLLH